MAVHCAVCNNECEVPCCKEHFVQIKFSLNLSASGHFFSSNQNDQRDERNLRFASSLSSWISFPTWYLCCSGNASKAWRRVLFHYTYFKMHPIGDWALQMRMEENVWQIMPAKLLITKLSRAVVWVVFALTSIQQPLDQFSWIWALHRTSSSLSSIINWYT